MLVLDQIVSTVGTVCLFIATGAMVAFLITEIAVFFHDRKIKKVKKENEP